MNSIYQLHRHAPPPPPSLQFSHRPQFLSKPILSLPKTTPPYPCFCVKASTFTSSPKPQLLKTLIRHSCIAITAAAFFFANLTYRVLPAVAFPVPPHLPPTVDSVEQSAFDEEKERSLEAFVASNPNDVKGLQSLMECKVMSQKIAEALVLLERLSSIEPDNIEWSLLRANLYSLSEEFKEMLKRIKAAMERCSKHDERKDDLSDFKLLLAQVKVFEGNYGDALKVYQELALEEPRDFRPYLCQGIVYTMLRREEEAKVQFEKYRKLVPEDHPYGQYLEENMFASMGMSQGVDDKTNSEKRLQS